LIGEMIPLAARIFAVVDVHDALTTERPYRPAWTKQAARAYIQDQSGILFDPKVAKAFLQTVGK
jgi:response regulator RpfG family c-di-GMP phosphodiesterase